MPTRSGCNLASDPIEQNDNNMASKPTEPAQPISGSEKEPIIADLYKLIVNSKEELKLDIKKSSEEIQVQIDSIKTRVDSVESKFEQHKSSVEQRLTEAQSNFTPS